MSDPTAVFDAHKTWALLQIREAKLLVMVRDPVLLGFICEFSESSHICQVATGGSVKDVLN